MTFKIPVLAFVVLAGIAPALRADSVPTTAPAAPAALPAPAGPATTQPAPVAVPEAVPTAVPPAAVPDADPAAAPPASPRDPTEPQAALRQAIENMHGTNATRTRASALPQVTRRGLVIVAGKPPQALIEVQGAGVFFVHEGSIVSSSAADGSVRMRIVKVTEDEIEIDVESQRQKVIIR